MVWFVAYGDPFATEIERWILASLLDRLIEQIKNFGLADAFELVPLTNRFRNLPDNYKLAAVLKGYSCLVDPTNNDNGYDSAFIAEGIALLFEALKAEVADEIDMSRQDGWEEESLDYHRRLALIFYFALKNRKIPGSIYETFCEQEAIINPTDEQDKILLQRVDTALKHGDITEALDIPKVSSTDIQSWKYFIDMELLHDRLFPDEDWLIDELDPQRSQKGDDAKRLQDQYIRQDLQDTLGINHGFCDPDYLKAILGDFCEHPEASETETFYANWIAPYTHMPPTVRHILKHYGQLHLLESDLSTNKIESPFIPGNSILRLYPHIERQLFVEVPNPNGVPSRYYFPITGLRVQEVERIEVTGPVDMPPERDQMEDIEMIRELEGDDATVLSPEPILVISVDELSNHIDYIGKKAGLGPGEPDENLDIN